MTDEEEQPEPVLIPVTPRFDNSGGATCEGCALFKYSEMQGYYCPAVRSLGCEMIPPYNCPIHNPKAHEAMEPL